MSEVSLSVVVPCFDLDRYVSECLDSLAPVGRDGGEIIVVDDCSTDRSAGVIEGWAAGYDGPCTTIFHPSNRGAPAVFNSGLAAASGPLLCFVDADDRVDAGALARQAERMAGEGEDVVAVFGDLDRIDESGEPLPGRILDWIRSIGGPWSGDVRSPLARNGSVCPLLGTVVRSADVHDTGGFDESLTFCDWPLWLNLAPRGRFVFSGEIAGQYRQRVHSMSREHRDRLDEDRLRLLSRIAGDASYRDQRADIAAPSAGWWPRWPGAVSDRGFGTDWGWRRSCAGPGWPLRWYGPG